jgi:menaquinone-specific isochorismate synthase
MQGDFAGRFLEYEAFRDGCLVSCSQPCPDISLMTFLKQALGKERFYWQDNTGRAAYAGFGVTANLMAWGANRFARISEKAKQLFHQAILRSDMQRVGPMLFGGFSFRDDFAPDNTWSVFNPAYFVLPHFQLAVIDGESWLTINALVPWDEEPEASVPQLLEALDARRATLQAVETSELSRSTRPVATNLNYPMPYSAWEQIIESATQRMRDTALDKVVLSRVCEIRFEQRVDVDSALDYLNGQYADCYRFLFEPRPFHAFFGATPELLADVDGHSLTTMSMASSIRRGSSALEDERLANQLMTDPKERYEHELVVKALKKRLAGFSESLEIPAQPSVVKLSNIQHLYTPIRGKLDRPDGVLPLVEALHPTPALGGSPRQLAMEFIREAEPVPRGWYAAPIGYLDHDLDGVFGVAIRSAVSQERRVWLYAGAGIVADSVPHNEWDETALKFKPILNALDLEIGVEL